MKGGRGRLLFISTVLPHRRRTGGEICSMNYIEGLQAAGFEVDVVAYQRLGDREPVPPGFFAPRELMIESANSRRQSLLWLGRALALNRPYSIQKYVTARMRAFVAERFARIAYDAVILDHAQIGWLLDAVPRTAKTAFIAHNVESSLYRMHAKRILETAAGKPLARLKAAVYRREGAAMRRAERRIASRCDQVWTLTEEERGEFQSLASDGAGKVRTFPVPGQTFASATGTLPKTYDVGLLGSWMWDVNREGLDWFLDSVAPLLPDGLRIAVAGKIGRQPKAPPANVRFLGFVDDAAEFMRACRVLVIPSTVGAGIQIKTIESIAAGVPLVATRVALRGIVERPSNVVEASEAGQMAARIEELLARLDRDFRAETEAWADRRRREFEAKIARAMDDLMSGRP